MCSASEYNVGVYTRYRSGVLGRWSLERVEGRKASQRLRGVCTPLPYGSVHVYSTEIGGGCCTVR